MIDPSIKTIDRQILNSLKINMNDRLVIESAH